jgi:hypothetical protein
MLGGSDRLSGGPEFTKLLKGAEAVSRYAQRIFTGRTSLAREYTEAEFSAEFSANGTTEPSDPDYQRLAQNEFADWRLAVGGLVEQPQSFSLVDLNEMPLRTQITRHDCVRLRTARRCACATSGNSMAKSCASTWLRILRRSATATAAIGNTRGMNGGPAFEHPLSTFAAN